ncbi:hypothetical protein U3516DRAFT_116340 [Neocallimastix sp. 'constans']
MSSKNNGVNITKQTINVLTVFLYNSRLCSQNHILNLVNFINFFITLIAVYIFYIYTIPSIRENHKMKYVITDYIVTLYYIFEISIRYILYTFYDITTYNRMNEFYNEKTSFLNLSERQYQIITIKENKNNNDIKKVKKKKKNLLHIIRFFLNKMEIICLLTIIIIIITTIIITTTTTTILHRYLLD